MKTSSSEIKNYMEKIWQEFYEVGKPLKRGGSDE